MAQGPPDRDVRGHRIGKWHTDRLDLMPQQAGARVVIDTTRVGHVTDLVWQLVSRHLPQPAGCRARVAVCSFQRRDASASFVHVAILAWGPRSRKRDDWVAAGPWGCKHASGQVATRWRRLSPAVPILAPHEESRTVIWRAVAPPPARRRRPATSRESWARAGGALLLSQSGGPPIRASNRIGAPRRVGARPSAWLSGWVTCCRSIDRHRSPSIDPRAGAASITRAPLRKGIRPQRSAPRRWIHYEPVFPSNCS